MPGFFPITTPDLVVYRGYHGVVGIASRDQVAGGRVIRAGELRWVSKTTFGLHQMVTKGDGTDIDVYKDATEWFGMYNQTKAGSILYENPLLGEMSHDGQNVYFVDDVAIPPPPVFYDPNFGGMTQGQQYRQSGDLALAIRAGRLVAVDIRTGMLKWELGRVKESSDNDPKAPPVPPLPNRLNEDEADRTTSAFELCLDAIFLGAPLPLNGKLYVLIEQAGVLRLVCLDPRNLVAVPGQTRRPALVWTQKIGRPNNNLPQDSIRRYQGASLAASEGIILCPTNSGAIVAVDTMSRSLLWAHAYKKINPPDRNLQPGGFRGPNGMMMPDQLKPDRWRAGGPIIANGRVVLTAFDSDFIECLDLRTGKVLWYVPREVNDLYIGGIINDRVVVVGRNQVRAYHLTGKTRRSKSRRSPSSRRYPWIEPHRPATESAGRACSTSPCARIMPAATQLPPPRSGPSTSRPGRSCPGQGPASATTPSNSPSTASAISFIRMVWFSRNPRGNSPASRSWSRSGRDGSTPRRQSERPHRSPHAR